MVLRQPNRKINSEAFRKLSVLIYILGTFLFSLRIVSAFNEESDIDTENTTVTLKKISDFHYEQVIIVRFNGQNMPIRDDTQLKKLDNYIIYKGTEPGKEDFFHPNKVKVSLTAPIIHLYAPLQQNVEYTLEIRGNVLRYENGEAVKGGIVKGLKLKERYFKFVKSPPFFDIDISPSGDNNLVFNLKFLKNWFPNEKTFVGISFDGKWALQRESSPDSLLLAFQVKRNLRKNGYFPFVVGAKLESTQDVTQANLVGYIEVESLVSIPNLNLTRTQFSPFPVVKIGYEYAGKLTGKQEDIKTHRLTSSLLWKIPFQRNFIINNKVNVIWDLKRNGDLYWLRENSLNYRVTKDLFLMLLKSIEGKVPPTFEYHRNTLTGFLLEF